MKRIVKCSAWVGGVILGVGILAALVLPSIIKVDKYRPQILDIANQSIHGKLEMGELSLSLWGSIRIRIDGLTLRDASGRSVVSAKDAYFRLPWLSMLFFSPEIILHLSKPEVQMRKEKEILNVTSLVKPSAPDKKIEAESSSRVSVAQSLSGLPSIAKRARLSLDIVDAAASYVDKEKKLNFQLSHLNLSAKNISLNRSMTIVLSTELKSEGAIAVAGPLKLEIENDPTLSGDGIEKVKGRVVLNADAVAIKMGDAFEKTQKVPAHFMFSFNGDRATLKLENMLARFHEFEVKGSGELAQWQSDKPVLSAVLQMPAAEFGSLKDLVPLLRKEGELRGKLSLESKVNGPFSDLNYDVKLEAKGLSAQNPMLKKAPEVNARVHVKTDRLEELYAELVAPGTQLRLDGKMSSLSHPKGEFRLTSKGMDLDQWIQFPETKGKGSSGEERPKSPSSSGGTAEKSDLDKTLSELSDVEAIKTADVQFVAALPYVRLKGATFEAISAKASLRKAAFVLDDMRLQVFHGKVQGSGGLTLLAKAPSYRFDTRVDGLDLKAAVASQFNLFKDTLYGKAFFGVKGSGSSVVAERAIPRLEASGFLRVENAKFATIDVGRMATESVNRILQTAREKVPGLRQPNVGPPKNAESEYELVSGTFSISKGKLNAPDFYAKARPRQGLDVRGATRVSLKETALEADWTLIDTHNVTGLRDISVEQAGVRVDSIFAAPNQPVQLPVVIRGTLFDPKPSYGSVAEALVQVAVSNVGRALESRAKQEAQQHLNNAVKDLGKQLFGR